MRISLKKDFVYTVAWNRQTEEKKQSRRKILENGHHGKKKSYGENGDFIIANEPEPHKIFDGTNKSEEE